MVLAFLWCCIFSSSGYAASDFKDPERLRQAWENPRAIIGNVQEYAIGFRQLRNQEKDVLVSAEMQNLAFVINQEIIYAHSPDWAHPTAERLKIIEKWALLLEPMLDDLIPLAVSSDFAYTATSKQAKSVLDFASPTGMLRAKTEPYLDTEGDVPLAAAEILSEHRLLSRAHVEVLENRFEEIPLEDSDRRLLWARRLSGLGVEKADQYLLDYLKNVLSAENSFESGEKLINFYGGVLGDLLRLGPKADSLIPDLEMVISKVERSFPDYVANFVRVRKAVSGEIVPPRRWALNGSGFINPLYSDQSDDINRNRSFDQNDLKSDSRKASIRRNLYLIFACVVCLGALCIYFRRKSRS